MKTENTDLLLFYACCNKIKIAIFFLLLRFLYKKQNLFDFLKKNL